MYRIEGIGPEDWKSVHPACETLYNFWLERVERAQDVPCLRDIDLADLWKIASHIYIMDAVETPERPEMRVRWRYVGTMLGELTGEELTGRFMDEAFSHSPDVAAAHVKVIREGKPHFWRRRFTNTATQWDEVTYERLVMPLKNDEGVVAHTLGIVMWPEEQLVDAGSDLHSVDRFNNQPSHKGDLISRSDNR